ncbi:MAG: UMP kinase, partial [Gammaproteobacteria bacterium]
MTAPLYQRLLLKLSGEALQGAQGSGIDPAILQRVAQEVAAVAKKGVQVGIVIGGGNYCRGATLETVGVHRVTGDRMGMLATVINSIA